MSKIKRLRNWLKQFPFLVFINFHVLDFKSLFLWGKTPTELLLNLSLFVPGSSGSAKCRAELALQAVNQTFPFLAYFLRSIKENKLRIIGSKEFLAASQDVETVAELKTYFDGYGSDKGDHEYHFIYAPILKKRSEITSVLEIGLGTNNTDVVSNMGAAGKPGASLRAFRDFLPKAMIYGADVDKRILFDETRIKTFFVDQTDLRTFEGLAKNIDSSFDLIIDDGLHAPNANLAVLSFGLSKLKIGGWLVIEDVVESAQPLWDVVAALLPPEYRTYMIRGRGGLVFAVNKLPIGN